MGSIGGINGGINSVGFTPQMPISIRKTAEDVNNAKITDGFENASAGYEVFNKSNLLSLMANSKPEAVDTNLKIAADSPINRAGDVELSLNGLNSTKFFYLEG